MSISTGLPPSFLGDSERENVHDERGNKLSVGKANESPDGSNIRSTV